jgi:alpha-1,2-mannosyltransferase
MAALTLVPPRDPRRALRLRAGVALALGLAAGIFGFTAAAGITGSLAAAGALALALAALTGWLAHRHPPFEMDAGAAPPPLGLFAAVAAVVALLLVARLAVFMVDPTQTAWSTVPSSEWERQHSCLTAYYVSAQAASTDPDIYEMSLSTLPTDDGTGKRKARMLGPFKIDVFEYPPPFLLLPRALLRLTPDFLDLRMTWFALTGAVVLLTVLALARIMGPSAGTRALLLSPLIWAAVPTSSTLQKGNVQMLIIAGSLLAMALFERRRWAAGGALLAFATASKLYPGLLVLYLVARRQWRAVGWTAAMGLVIGLATAVDIGWEPYRHFLDHLPGLLGGEAFPAFRNPTAMAINFSIPGIVFKLGLWGVPGMSFPASKAVGWLFTIVAVALTIQAARRSWRDEEKPLIWMGILILATLRSPFLPQAYAAFPVLWILTLLAARSPLTGRRLAWVLLGWVTLNIFWPMDWPISPALLALINAIPQTLTLLLAVFALRLPEPAPDPVPQDSEVETVPAS